MASCFALGPQRPTVNLGLPFKSMASEGAVALVSAGWQEAECDFEHVQEAISRPLVGLRLYGRAEEVFSGDAQVRHFYRERQNGLMELQRLYRIRLRQSMIAARRLLREEGDTLTLRHEQRHALSQLRALDRHHLQRINAIHAEFSAEFAELTTPVLEQHRAEIAAQLADCDTVLLTGGNVTVLLNRLRLFNIGPLLENKSIVAWSAGAMALSDRIILFHDNTAEGNRDAELIDAGLGIINKVVFLPDAKHRLKLADKIRTAIFCRRFAPASCMTLDSGSLLRFDQGRVSSAEGVRRLSRSGNLRKVRVR